MRSASCSVCVSVVNRSWGEIDVANEIVAWPIITEHTKAEQRPGRVRRADMDVQHEPAAQRMQACREPIVDWPEHVEKAQDLLRSTA